MIDPTKQAHPWVPHHGWSVHTPDEMFAVLSQMMGHLQRRGDGDGLQLLGRLWRVNNPVLMGLAAMGEPTHTYQGQGAYRMIGNAYPAGTLKGSHVITVYRDVKSDVIYYRTAEDFNMRMVQIGEQSDPPR